MFPNQRNGTDLNTKFDAEPLIKASYTRIEKPTETIVIATKDGIFSHMQTP